MNQVKTWYSLYLAFGVSTLSYEKMARSSWRGALLRFKLGLSLNYKPSTKEASAAFRHFDISRPSQEDRTPNPDEQQAIWMENEPQVSVAGFRRMSLSSSLESLLDKYFVRLLQLRKTFNLGWASAEELLWKSEIAQDDPVNVLPVNKEVRGGSSSLLYLLIRHSFCLMRRKKKRY